MNKFHITRNKERGVYNVSLHLKTGEVWEAEDVSSRVAIKSLYDRAGDGASELGFPEIKRGGGC